jgi:hypothetical protein
MAYMNTQRDTLDDREVVNEYHFDLSTLATALLNKLELKDTYMGQGFRSTNGKSDKAVMINQIRVLLQQLIPLIPTLDPRSSMLLEQCHTYLIDLDRRIAEIFPRVITPESG